MRLPPLPPYNTFLLNCSEALPKAVSLQVQFTWQRSRDAGGFSNLTVPEGINTVVGGATIVRMDGDRFSVLNVTETVSGDYTYRCSGVLTIPDDTAYMDDADVIVNVTSKCSSCICTCVHTYIHTYPPPHTCNTHSRHAHHTHTYPHQILKEELHTSKVFNAFI